MKEKTNPPKAAKALKKTTAKPAAKTSKPVKKAAKKPAVRSVKTPKKKSPKGNAPKARTRAEVLAVVLDRLHAYNIHRNASAGSDIKWDFRDTDEEDQATNPQGHRVDSFLNDLRIGIVHPVNIGPSDLIRGDFETPTDITDFIMP